VSLPQHAVEASGLEDGIVGVVSHLFHPLARVRTVGGITT
jgi:hypothetical protein